MDAKEVFKKYLPSIVFNVAEVLIIYLIGLALSIEPSYCIFIMLTWTIARLLIGKPKHYKAWQKCLIWTTLLFLSLFVVARTELLLSIIMSAFCALIMSGRADIKDAFMWKPKGESKYQREIEYVKYNPIAQDLIAFEDRLQRDNDNLSLMCYEYIFKQGRSWQEAANDLDTETYKLAPVVEKIAFGIRLSCKI